MPLSLTISLVVFVLIAVRQWLPAKIQIWHIMCAGALAVLVTGSLSLKEAWVTVDWNVIAYLAGVFLISHALLVSGFSERLSTWIAARRASATSLLALFMLFITGVSTVLTNDAAAAMGAPIAIAIAAMLQLHPRVLLIALCSTVTIGSMFSPVGNPQNLLIVADSALSNPVATFLVWLAPPSVLSLGFSLLWFRFLLRREPLAKNTTWQMPRDPGQRQWPALLSTGLLAGLVLANSFAPIGSWLKEVPLGALSLAATLPLLALSRRRWAFVRANDWPTLLFFVAMFIVTGAVLKSGVLQQGLGPWHNQLGDPFLLGSIAFLGSQIFSNVPLVEIYLNLLQQRDTATLMLLSGISTLAGNLFIISAASNVIIVQQSERYGLRAFTFWQFTATVLPVTLVSLGLCYGWVALLSAWIQ